MCRSTDAATSAIRLTKVCTAAFVEIYHQVTDYNDAQIAFTRDMTHWYRPERRAIIPCGPIWQSRFRWGKTLGRAF